MVFFLALHQAAQHAIDGLADFLAQPVFFVAWEVVEVDLQKQDQLSALMVDGSLWIGVHGRGLKAGAIAPATSQFPKAQARKPTRLSSDDRERFQTRQNTPALPASPQ